jgi:predicted nucleotidyltransferase
MIKIENHLNDIKKLCITHNVDKMYLFGSALNSNFSERSDVDLLVKFKPLHVDYFNNYLDFKDELKKVFGREVDLLEEQTLKNPILINSINRSKKLIYG